MFPQIQSVSAVAWGSYLGGRALEGWSAHVACAFQRNGPSESKAGATLSSFVYLAGRARGTGASP